MVSTPFLQNQGPNFWNLNGLYPNPFSDALTVAFTLGKPAELRFRAYNVAGEPVWEESLRFLPGQNFYRWKGVNSQLAVAASGVYLVFLRFQAEDGDFGEDKALAVIAR